MCCKYYRIYERVTKQECDPQIYLIVALFQHMVQIIFRGAVCFGVASVREQCLGSFEDN
jgi:hypothetical protein